MSALDDEIRDRFAEVWQAAADGGGMLRRTRQDAFEIKTRGLGLRAGQFGIAAGREHFRQLREDQSAWAESGDIFQRLLRDYRRVHHHIEQLLAVAGLADADLQTRNEVAQHRPGGNTGHQASDPC